MVDKRRLKLYELLKPTLGEEPAQELVAMFPPDPEQLATRDWLETRFAWLETKFAAIDTRFAQLETTLTRRMIAVMGAWTVLIGSAFAWAGLLLRP